jgi:PAS domain S-box-containing protein
LANGFDTFLNLIDPADRGRVLEMIDAHRTNREGYVTEFRLQHKSGQTVWIKMRGKTVFGPGGHPQLLCGSAVDVSREKAMESALTESERRLNFALEGSSQGAWDWDLRSGSVFFSPRWKSRLGYRDGQPEDTARAWEALIHPDDLARVRLCIRRYLVRESEGFEVEFRQWVGDGTYRWIQARGMIVESDDAGTPTRMIGTHADIDDRKQAEERLRLAAAVIEHAKEAIVTTDADNRILAVNPAFTAMTG